VVEKPSLAYVSPYYDPAVPSGANRRFDEICRRLLRDYGDNFTLVVSRGAIPEWWDGKNLVAVDYRFNHASKVSATREIARALDRLPPSLVIMESLPLPLRALKRHTHFQTAYDFRYFYSFSKGAVYRLLFTRYLRQQWRRCQYIITCSDASIDELERHVSYPRERVVKSFFGINPDIFDVPHVPAEDKEYDLIYVGHFDGHKNHARLIDALGLMDSGLKVLFVGVDNGLLGSLKQRAVKLGLTNIQFTTVREERKVWDLYTRSRAFVSPSVYEGFGMPTIEALALGLPVVLSDIRVFHEVGRDLATYFDPRDPRDIAAKLAGALGDPTPPDRDKVRAHLEQFTWDEIYKELQDDLQRR